MAGSGGCLGVKMEGLTIMEINEKITATVEAEIPYFMMQFIAYLSVFSMGFWHKAAVITLRSMLAWPLFFIPAFLFEGFPLWISFTEAIVALVFSALIPVKRKAGPNELWHFTRMRFYSVPASGFKENAPMSLPAKPFLKNEKLTFSKLNVLTPLSSKPVIIGFSNGRLYFAFDERAVPGQVSYQNFMQNILQYRDQIQAKMNDITFKQVTEQGA